MKESEQTVDFSEEYPLFPDHKRGEYTVLAPDMLPWHFELLTCVMGMSGYNVEVIKEEGRAVIDEGLKHVHNDTCFPALCVIGQYLTALKSGRYDLNRTAVMITQSGGGCRASNYIPLIRKALKAEFPQVPVLSLNFSGLEKDSGMRTGPVFLLRAAYAIMYGDLVMTCYNQTRPYEQERGGAERTRERCMAKLKESFLRGDYRKFKRNVNFVLEAFAAVPVADGHKIKVGIVGEIYVKYSPLGNSHLEEFLLAEGCEPVVPALMDFILYCVVNNVNDEKFYGKNRRTAWLFSLVYKWMYGKQKQLIRLMKAHKRFAPVHDFEHLRACADLVIHQGVKMGEGWLIPAEMAALAQSGTQNVVCAQPFGCLPNHIAGKGAVRAVKSLCPDLNVVPVDYDPSATKVNQENRIKLMLATAKERLERS